MTSPFGGDEETADADELLGDLGEGEPDDSSDETGAGGEDPAAR